MQIAFNGKCKGPAIKNFFNFEKNFKKKIPTTIKLKGGGAKSVLSCGFPIRKRKDLMQSIKTCIFRSDHFP